MKAKIISVEGNIVTAEITEFYGKQIGIVRIPLNEGGLVDEDGDWPSPWCDESVSIYTREVMDEAASNARDELHGEMLTAVEQAVRDREPCDIGPNGPTEAKR